MIYTVINDKITVKKIKIDGIATASSVFVGNINRIALSNWLDSPAEDVIVGVTTGVAQPRGTSASEKEPSHA